MSKYTLVVLTNAAAGKEEEFNDWYDNRHLKDVLQIPGFVAAQRFKIVAQPVASEPLYRYYAAYEVESDDPLATMQEMMSRVGTIRLPMSDAIAPQYSVALYEAITPGGGKT